MPKYRAAFTVKGQPKTRLGVIITAPNIDDAEQIALEKLRERFAVTPTPKAPRFMDGPKIKKRRK